MTYKGSFQLFLQPIENHIKISKLNISLLFKCRKPVKLAFLILKVGVELKKRKKSYSTLSAVSENGTIHVLECKACSWYAILQ